MKKTILVFGLFLASSMTFATSINDSNGGGDDKKFSFQSLFNKYVKYPSKARKEKVETTVIVEFSVNESGEITNIKSLTQQGYDLETEAVRVLTLLNDQHKEAIAKLGLNGTYRLPVKFDLD